MKIHTVILAAGEGSRMLSTKAKSLQPVGGYSMLKRIYETVFGIGWATGPVIAGIVSQMFGNEIPYLVFCVIGIGVAILSITKRRLLEPNKNTNL